MVMKIKYYNDIIEENKPNMKEMRMILNKTIVKMNAKSCFSAYFNIDGACVSDKLEIAKGFNKYCAHIGNKNWTKSSCVTSQLYTLLNSINRWQHINFIKPINTSTMISTAGKLTYKLNSVHNDISSTLLKETISMISQPLTHIIYVSLDTEIVPDALKIAKVVPFTKQWTITF